MDTKSQKTQLSISIEEQLASKPPALLSKASGLPVSEIKRAMKKGAVWLTRSGAHKRIRRADTKLKLGDVLGLYYNPEVLSQQVEDCQLLFDEKDYSVWFKPAGVLSQGSLWGDHTTINRFVENYFPVSRPAFIVSRLDRAASGLMMIAHGKKSAAKLSALFENKHIDKQYLAIVVGDASTYQTKLLDDSIDGKDARSIVNCLSVKQNNSLLQVKIETGRKHQIRKHLAAEGLPIIGDRMFGHAVQGDVDLQLRCSALAFISPFTQQECSYTLPEHLLLNIDADNT